MNFFQNDKKLCVIGFDAHTPQALAGTAVYDRALEIVRQYGLELLDTVPLRPLD
jgi:hypothetical protein